LAYNQSQRAPMKLVSMFQLGHLQTFRRWGTRSHRPEALGSGIAGGHVCYDPGMNWRPWKSDLDVKTILIVVIVVGMGAVALRYQLFPRLNPNAGFGPDWDCTMQAKGDPVCIKKRPSR
jgi:hypothetical protein